MGTAESALHFLVVWGAAESDLQGLVLLAWVRTRVLREVCLRAESSGAAAGRGVLSSEAAGVVSNRHSELPAGDPFSVTTFGLGQSAEQPLPLQLRALLLHRQEMSGHEEMRWRPQSRRPRSPTLELRCPRLLALTGQTSPTWLLQDELPCWSAWC